MVSITFFLPTKSLIEIGDWHLFRPVDLLPPCLSVWISGSSSSVSFRGNPWIFIPLLSLCPLCDVVVEFFIFFLAKTPGTPSSPSCCLQLILVLRIFDFPWYFQEWSSKIYYHEGEDGARRHEENMGPRINTETVALLEAEHYILPISPSSEGAD